MKVHNLKKIAYQESRIKQEKERTFQLTKKRKPIQSR